MGVSSLVERDGFVTDFEQDLDQILRGRLQAWGLKFSTGLQGDALRLEYVRLSSHMIRPRPRRLHIASDLSWPERQEVGVKILLGRALVGWDLAPFQGRGLLNPIKTPDRIPHERLLYHWGIHHFHLGAASPVIGPGDSVGRTSELLFARVTDSDFFALAVLDHDSFNDLRLVEILHRNWPESIQHLRLQGVVGLEHSVSASERKILRRKHVNEIVELRDGTIYAPLGGGVVCSGDPLDARIESDWVRRVLDDWQRASIATLAEWCSENRALPTGAPVEVKLEIKDNLAWARVVGMAVVCRLGEVPKSIRL